MILETRWRKVLADLWANKIRTILVVLSIGVGVFAVGMVSSSFLILLHDMDADYQSTNPYGAIIYSEPFGDDLIATLDDVPGVGEVEGRSSTSARVLDEQGNKTPIAVFAIPDVDQMKISRIRPNVAGEELHLNRHEILIERSGLAAVQVKPGDTIHLELYDGRIRELRVSGIVSDVSFPSYAFSGQIFAFVNVETMAWLGGLPEFNQLYLTVEENKKDEQHVTAVANAVADKIEKGGRQVYQTFVYQPGRHFASDITSTLGVMMSFLGGLAVLLSVFLVTSTISALLGQHIRQIGMMKAVGARTDQVMGMYLVLVLAFGVLALLFAGPLGALVGYGVSVGVSQFLNFNIGPFRIPWITVVLDILVALVIPLLAAVVPIRRGARITIREALSSYGLSAGGFGKGFFDRMLERVQHLPRPLLISLRNTFRRKGRLVMTLSTLTLAGAIFIGVFNVRASFYQAIDKTLGYFLSDVTVDFNRYYRIQRVNQIAESVPGVVQAEGWGGSMASVLSEDQKSETEVYIFAPPAESTLIQPVITSGRWLLPDDKNAVVVGNHFLTARSDVRTGDTIWMDIDGKEYPFEVVGVYQIVGNVVPPIIYVNYEYLTQLQNQVDQILNLRVVTEPQDAATQTRVKEDLEIVFSEAGISVGGMTTGAENMDQQRVTIDVLIYFLLIMAVLIALVGGLGLMGTMSMNVMERTREIGVMRSIGAKDNAILIMVVVEGTLIGLISWVLGAILALPISWLLDYVVGNAFVTTALGFVVSLDGFVIWLIGVMVISAVASWIPARNAVRLTVRDVLAYE